MPEPQPDPTERPSEPDASVVRVDELLSGSGIQSFTDRIEVRRFDIDDPLRADSQISAEDQRRNYETRISGRLAFSLWLALGAIAILHVIGIGILTYQLVRIPTLDKTRSRQFDRAFGEVHDTAKTIYTFLTLLATAVTG